jgi:hypothetical protein
MRPRVTGVAVALALIVAVVVVQSAAGGGLTPTTSSTTTTLLFCSSRTYGPGFLTVNPTMFAPGQTIHVHGEEFVHYSPDVTSADGCEIPTSDSGPTTVYLVVGGRTYLLATPTITSGGFSIEVVVPLTVVGRGLGYIGACPCDKYLPVTVVDPIGPPAPVERTPDFTG